MRDVAVVSFVQSAVARDFEHNEVEMLVPTLHAAICALMSPMKVSGMRTFWRSIRTSVSL